MEGGNPGVGLRLRLRLKLRIEEGLNVEDRYCSSCIESEGGSLGWLLQYLYCRVRLAASILILQSPVEALHPVSET